MTRNEFYAACEERTLLPSLVLEESEEIRQAVHNGDDEKILRLLDQFA